MDREAGAVSVDVCGRVRLELDGDISGGCVEFKTGLGASMLTQDSACEVISIIKGQQVIFPNVQPKT